MICLLPKLKTLIYFCYLILLLVGFQPVANAIELESGPTGTLTEEKSISLPVSPLRVVVLDQYAYVIGQKSGGDQNTTTGENYQLLQLDSTTMAIVATFDVPFVPFDVAISFSGEFVYLAGTHKDTTELLVLSAGLEKLGAVSDLDIIAYPTLSEAREGILVVGGMETDSIKAELFAVDVSDPTTPQVISDQLSEEYNLFGVTGAWMDNREQENPTVFLNVGRLPVLAAFGIGAKGPRALADIRFDEKSRIAEPLKTLASMPGRSCASSDNSLEGNQEASFLISSVRNGNLFLVDYDPDFESLDIIGKTTVDLAFPENIDWATFEASEVRLPSSLLTSSCDRGVIWIGNKHSKDIEQFTLNPLQRSLEKVGQIRLTHEPEDLAIDHAGGAAFVISFVQNSITRYTSGDNEASGTEAGREIQRLLTERDFPVGAIDGKIGVMTLNAASRFERRNNVQLDITGNIEEAINIVKSIPLKTYK